jgi:hypothetical protein
VSDPRSDPRSPYFDNPRDKQAIELKKLELLNNLGRGLENLAIDVGSRDRGPAGLRGEKGQQGWPGHDGRDGRDGESIFATRNAPAPDGGTFSGRAPYAPIASSVRIEDAPGWTIQRVTSDALGRPIVATVAGAAWSLVWRDREQYVYTFDLLATTEYRSIAKRLARSEPASEAAIMLAGTSASGDDALRQVNALTAILERRPEIIDTWMDDGWSAAWAALKPDFVPPWVQAATP